MTMMTMDEILELERQMHRQKFEAQVQTARYEATSKAINDVMDAFWTVYTAQVTALMYAGLNPNFCRPKASP